MFAGAGQADADIGVFALAGAVDHTAHDRDGHILNARILLGPFRHFVADVGLDILREMLEVVAGGAATARTGNHRGGEAAHIQALQDFLGDDDFLRARGARFWSQ